MGGETKDTERGAESGERNPSSHTGPRLGEVIAILKFLRTQERGVGCLHFALMHTQRKASCPH